MKRSACTSILVGKRASLDGSVMIARNEDFYSVIDRKIFKVFKATEEENRKYTSENTKVTVDLPSKAYRYTATPSEDPDEIGVYSESGINEKNVAVSATESLYGNSRVLSLDPLIKNGIAEDAINDIVTPFIDSAREGVVFLGNLIAKHGSAEGNGILFADKDEAWYMEIPTGHHWVAVRIPDDCYAVAPNHVCIEQVDFNDEENYLWSDNIRDFVEQNNLNPDYKGFCFRRIFGTYSESDRVYNTPRAWYAHRYLNPKTEYDPTSGDIPFIQKPERKITVEDVQFILSSHYNETVYDPLGKEGSELERKKFRAISLSRTQQSHILQIRNDIDAGVAAIHWLAFATTAFTPYVPFFANVNDSPESYKNMTKDLNLKNAYWLFKVFSYYAEEHYGEFYKDTEEFLSQIEIYARQRINEITQGAEGKESSLLTDYLTLENEKTADEIIKRTKKQLQNYATRALSFSRLSFKMDKNL